MFHRYKIRNHERGLLFREGAFVDVLQPGVHWYVDPLLKMRLDVVSPRDPWLRHKDLDLIAKSGKLAGEAIVADLEDFERALVWIDGRFAAIVADGLYVLWTSEHEIRVEIADARTVQFAHAGLAAIAQGSGASAMLEMLTVTQGCVALWFLDGVYQATLGPGVYAFWKNAGVVKIHVVDMKEVVFDISGQEIMTADKVTLRMNALVAYRITDPLRSVTEVDGAAQALYRTAQLALREAVGAGGRARNPRGHDRNQGRHPAGRDEGPDEQGHRGEEGRGGVAHHPA